MIGKLYNALAVFCIALVMALSGMGAYLLSAGRLSGATLEAVVAALRGGAPTVAASVSAPATSHPATPRDHATPAASGEALRSQRRADRVRSALIERAARDLAARQDLLDQSLQNLVKLQEELESNRKAFEAQRAKQADAGRDEGFARELEYVAKLSPKLAKEHVVRTFQKSKPDAVRLFMALETAQGQRILEQLKTPEEIELMHDLLEQIRVQDVSVTPGSGTTQSEPTEGSP